MPTINYVAKRDLITGHVASTSYDIETEATQIDQGHVRDATIKTSLGGKTTTVLRKQDKKWSMTIGPFARTGGEGTLEQVIEFLSSVAGGEAFTLDPYGTLASPDNAVAVVLDSKGYSPKRLGLSDYFTISFVAKVAS